MWIFSPLAHFEYDTFYNDGVVHGGNYFLAAIRILFAAIGLSTCRKKMCVLRGKI